MDARKLARLPYLDAVPSVCVPGREIRQVQQLLGHEALKTTVIYTHVMNKPSIAVTSPLDRMAAVDLPWAIA